MKVKKATTQLGLFGVTLYFNTYGNKIGEARPHGKCRRTRAQDADYQKQLFEEFNL